MPKLHMPITILGWIEETNNLLSLVRLMDMTNMEVEKKDGLKSREVIFIEKIIWDGKVVEFFRV